MTAITSVIRSCADAEKKEEDNERESEKIEDTEETQLHQLRRVEAKAQGRRNQVGQRTRHTPHHCSWSVGGAFNRKGKKNNSHSKRQKLRVETAAP